MTEEENAVGVDTAEQTQEENVGSETVVANENSTKVEEADKVSDNMQEEVAKSFTQEQVNDIVRERLEKDQARLFKRYGVEDRKGLDDMIGKAQAYDIMKEQFIKLKDDNFNTTKELSFLRNNINPERNDDIMAHFKGKEMDFNEENLKNELATHPEWLNAVKVDDKPKTTIKVMGSDNSVEKLSVNEQDQIAKMFGFNNGFIIK